MALSLSLFSLTLFWLVFWVCLINHVGKKTFLYCYRQYQHTTVTENILMSGMQKKKKKYLSTRWPQMTYILTRQKFCNNRFVAPANAKKKKNGEEQGREREWEGKKSRGRSCQVDYFTDVTFIFFFRNAVTVLGGENLIWNSKSDGR